MARRYRIPIFAQNIGLATGRKDAASDGWFYPKDANEEALLVAMGCTLDITEIGGVEVPAMVRTDPVTGIQTLVSGDGTVIEIGGGGGSSTFDGLSDKTSADIPATNTPTATALGLKAPLASPTFTGTPAAPTASPGTNTTQIATTAFVLANGGAAFGPYADASALESAKPAASNPGRIGYVGASAPYVDYVSTGSAWAEVVTSAGSAGDPYVAVASSGASQSVNVSTAGMVDITLTANCTLSLTGATSGAAFSVRLVLRQDGVGSRTVTWPGSTKWSLGVAPTLSTAANAIDEAVLTTYDGGTSFFGDLVAKGRA